MKINEQQLQLLFLTLTDSVKVDITRIFTLDHETRHALWKQISEQQSTVLTEIGEDVS